jgi:hypothetical protein
MLTACSNYLSIVRAVTQIEELKAKDIANKEGSETLVGTID